MVVAHLQEAGHTISASVLRLRRQFDCQSVCVARCSHRIGTLSGSQQSPVGNAAFALGFDAAGAEVPTNVHSVHTSEVIPSDAG